MPMFLHQWGYKDESVRAMVVEREDREEVVRLATEAFGGTLHHFYYCFGDYDGCAISEFADTETALACVMAVFGQGRVRSVKTTLLFTPDQGARAIGRAWDIVAKRDGG
jgi:uncharacterized protein with GYD domain